MNILITGCKRGIGLSAAIELSNKGHNVYGGVKYLKEANKLNKKYEDITFFKMNINNEKDRAKILDFGIDVLINNAAIGESGSAAEIPVDRVRENFETNVFNSLELTQLILKDMIKKDRGRIIFIGSKAALMPRIWMSTYSATKSAIRTFAVLMRKELKEISSNIKVILVEPGAYHTGFNQEIMNTKYEWLTDDSYFNSIQNKIKEDENDYFDRFESKNLDSIARKIVKAVESDNPCNYYAAPCHQSIAVWFYKTFTK